MAIEFNEGETGFLTLAFTDQDGDPITPDSAAYTLYNEKDSAIINSRNATAIGSLAASVDLELTPADNVIVDTERETEQHVLYVRWVYNTDKVGQQEQEFNVINLTKVT